ATLNLAATGAQCARIFEPYDAAFAADCLDAAETAWQAAQANPEIYAPAGGVGGGPYNDDNVTDEFYWAAAELFITTGEQSYADAVTSSPLHTEDVFTAGGFSWNSMAPLARMDLATVPNDLPDRDRVRDTVVAGADQYLAALQSSPWDLPYDPYDNVFVWGSNSQVLNNMVVMATAFDLTGDEKYRDGVLAGMDYILGRNALNQSYVTGYGENDAKNQHSRWYANQLDSSLPNPPDGTVSGGPNSQTETWDPVAQDKLEGCAPQFCYIDDIESWATNELTVNWNAPLSWLSSFIADQDNAATLPETGVCTVSYTQHEKVDAGLNNQVVVTNTSDEPIDEWQLDWSFLDGQTIGDHWNAAIEQDGAAVTATNADYNGTMNPGDAVTFGFITSNPQGALAAPEQFWLNGAACDPAPALNE
ncbi:glycoside hydrolase family 9 protein, partial [Salinactinospora qingdaonensis]|uniref:glycoside hydrolase family 9 protein n=1 Tax=Salinactinospora qingdaonensis TaxID=702744 RepID=UPI0031E5E523